MKSEALTVVLALIGIASLLVMPIPHNIAHAADELRSGRALYRFYCYQCHGYSGDGNTLAASVLASRPRNFTASSPTELPIESIVDVVLNGKENTAMVSFSGVMTAQDARNIARYVHDAFMSAGPENGKYHTADNGWPDHERYAAAFPFVDGTVSLATAWELLSPVQLRGRRLFESACVTCHDQPNVPPRDYTIWKLRSVSYPRAHFSHRLNDLDLVSRASPYALHDQPPAGDEVTAKLLTGRELFADNCAFCHANDGSGRNWIGSFLDQQPRNLTARETNTLRAPDLLRQRIREGIAGTSMPAWEHVLSETEIDAVAGYIEQVLQRPAE